MTGNSRASCIPIWISSCAPGGRSRADYLLFVFWGQRAGACCFISQAYRLSEAAFAAPFEYVSMPMAILWGVTVFGTWPDRVAWVGIALILGSGLYLVWRESRKGKGGQAKAGPANRRAACRPRR